MILPEQPPESVECGCRKADCPTCGPWVAAVQAAMVAFTERFGSHARPAAAPPPQPQGTWIPEIRRHLSGRDLAVWTGRHEDGTPLDLPADVRERHLRRLRGEGGCGCGKK